MNFCFHSIWSLNYVSSDQKLTPQFSIRQLFCMPFIYRIKGKIINESNIFQNQGSRPKTSSVHFLYTCCLTCRVPPALCVFLSIPASAESCVPSSSATTYHSVPPQPLFSRHETSSVRSLHKCCLTRWVPPALCALFSPIPCLLPKFGDCVRSISISWLATYCPLCYPEQLQASHHSRSIHSTSSHTTPRPGNVQLVLPPWS